MAEKKIVKTSLGISIFLHCLSFKQLFFSRLTSSWVSNLQCQKIYLSSSCQTMEEKSCTLRRITGLHLFLFYFVFQSLRESQLRRSWAVHPCSSWKLCTSLPTSVPSCWHLPPKACSVILRHSDSSVGLISRSAPGTWHSEEMNETISPQEH